MKFALPLTFCLLVFSISGSKAQVFNSFYNEIAENVSAANLSNDLTTLVNFGVKEPGTNAIENAKDWIINRYQTLGYTDIETQPFTVYGQVTSNIIVTKTGSVYPNTFLILDGHYDTLNGPGANDNGSGTVLLLELARLLKNVDTEYSIKFIHFSGEEEGLIGSEYYVNNTVIPENLDIKLVLNIDEVGGVAGMNNNTIVCERDESAPNSNNAASAQATQEMANCFGLYSSLQTTISNAYGSDYVPFENNGEIITGLYEANESPYPHTPDDVIENMDLNYVFEVTKGALGSALHFALGREPLGVFENDFTKNIVIFPNPSKGQFTVSFSALPAEKIELTVFDVLGKMIYNNPLNNSTNYISISGLKRGIYFGIFQSENYRVVKKIVLE
ncbi:M28 family peptidase [Aequorivita flava]|uniref:M28 family peptidase n=1 Tax=Aequorivita flava TaxID=3114371 RepID=A0AB35YQD5_9FLAO